LKQRPAAAEMMDLAEPWRPWRGVAAHVLWNYYRAVKKRDAIPVQASGANSGG
jgi:DNA-3-methyladenine glycosylase II